MGTNRTEGCYRVVYGGSKEFAMWDGEFWYFFGRRNRATGDEVIVTDPTPIDPNPAPKQKLPAAEVQQMGIDFAKDASGMGGRRATYHDGLAVGYYKGFRDSEKMYAEHPAPQPAGQLTAEELLKDRFIDPATQCWFVPVIEVMHQYATQHTAAKDAEIAKLRDNVCAKGKEIIEAAKTIDYWSKKWGQLNSARFNLLSEIEQKDARIKELEKALSEAEWDNTEIITMKAQRDEAVKLLRDWQEFCSFIADGAEVSENTENFLSQINQQAPELVKEDVKAESLWISVKQGPPAKPGILNYEHVRCLVRGGKYHDDILMWNCEHNVWDDESGDDYECDFDAVEWYLPLSELPAPPESLTDKK